MPVILGATKATSLKLAVIASCAERLSGRTVEEICAIFHQDLDHSFDFSEVVTDE